MDKVVERLYIRRQSINKKIKEYQDLCLHKNLKMIPRSNTGNLDTNDDLYWLECKCVDCDKYWWEPQ
jgi:hypothetical protein